MRIEHIEHRLDQQLETIELLKSAVDNLVKVGSSNITPYRIETRSTALEELWEKFSATHDAIGIAITQLQSQEREKIQRHNYFRKKLSRVAYELHLEASEKIKELSNVTRQPIQRSSSVASFTHSSSQHPLWHQGPRLPRIDLPKFDGTPSEWLPFKDLFDSLVLSNQSLSSVEKLQYLKTSLTGSAEAILKNTALTADNFQKAWDALEAFYENKRLLVNSALHSLLTLKRMTKESATEMEHLYTGIMQIVRTLDTLGRPVHTWDDFLVFIATQRLDAESVKAWEHHLGPSKDPPTWNQLSEFLMTRMLSLKAFEKSRQGKTPHQQHQTARTYHTDQKSDDKDWKSNCPFCSENHYAATCEQFSNKTVEQRNALINKHNLCYNCLGRHRVSACRSARRCMKCGKKHHTSIHTVKPSTSDKENSAPASTNVQTSHASLEKPISTIFTLLATAQVVVSSESNRKTQARALIDPGSQISFISERLVQHLHLTRSKSSVLLHGIGAVKAGRTKGKATVTLTPHFNSNQKCLFSAHILPKLTSTIPTARASDLQSWPHLKGLTLADPHFNIPGRIDILIGSDYYGRIIEEGLRKGDENSPIAQQTIFGWILSGSPKSFQPSGEVQGFQVCADQELYDLLQRFWQLEEIPVSNRSKLSAENQQCEEHFLQTHSRDDDGHYVVKLPLKSSLDKLGESRSYAAKVLASLEKRFSKSPSFHKAYSDFLKEYDSLKHMQLIPTGSSEPEHSYYLPHHGVIRETSLTTKLRVVFNGSSRTSTGIALNDILHTGAKLQVDLLDVLLWFRQFRYVFSSDIEKMYRQIRVHKDDWNLQRILWSESGKIVTYQLTTVTYGLACAPFLALRVVLQLVKDEGSQYPLAIPSLIHGRYVDDVFGGADTIEQAQKIAKQTNDLCMAGGFPLQKWISNDPQILHDIPPERCIKPPSVVINEETTVHALGLCWNPHADTFHFSMKIPAPEAVTKRSILSMIAQIFDPLGFLSPVIIRAKIFMQELWSLKLGWDDTLPHQLSARWMEFYHDLKELPKLSFPRWLVFQKESSLQIHGFCDASQQAIAAIVYIRSITNGVTRATLICSKTKVAPLKRMTIPRLELSGAVMLTKLIAHVTTVLSLNAVPIYVWTDSAIVYTWLNNHPSRWKDFVHNRVCFIQETLPHATWRLIPGKENPADCSTRGLTTSQLSQHSTWWTGPAWLECSSDSWPVQPTNFNATDDLEERSAQITTAISARSPAIWDLLSRYSNLTRLLRITAICQLAAARFKKVPESSMNNPLTTSDIEQARQFWIKAIQSAYFHEELKSLTKNEHLSKSHPLSKLTPYVDQFGFLRLGGRLQSSLLPEDSKHPFILPRNSTLTNLIIKDAHLRTLHGGTQSTLSFIRENYWIIGGRAPVRSFILKCVPCTRYRQKRAEQLMGQLPSVRITPSRPFLHSGIDYAGPICLKTWRGRASRSYKAYIALFVCLSTSAIHLELVTDYTAEAFIAAYKRFTARRGICATLRSDCGTNLKGADSELTKLFSSASTEAKQLASLLSNDGTQWIFNPPAAPHFGGKWEAGVKSVKYHLRRITGENSLTYEEMYTLLTQIEAVLNSRPLSPMTEDPDDLSCLTPGHFLMGHAPCIVPEPSLEMEKVTRLSRWQRLRQMLDSFWTKWSKECLQRYQAIYKWKESHTQIKEGSLVLLMDERYPPAKWALGRVQKLHPGPDGLTRVVTIKTQTSIFKRPITKICPLPIETDSL